MKKRSLLINTFISFALFLVFILVIAFTIFNYNITNYSQYEISESNIGKLKVLRGLNDFLIYSISKDALILSLDSDLNKLYNTIKSQSNIDKSQDTIALESVLQKLNQMVNSNEYVQSIYIYSKNGGYIISSKTGVDDIKNFYDTDWLKYYKHGDSKSFWLNTRIPINENIYKDLSKVNLLSLDTNYVSSFVYPLTKYTTDLEGAIVINVYENKLNYLINNKSKSKDGYVFIVNKKGDVISHIDKGLISKSALNISYMKNILSNNNSEGYLISDVNNKKQLVTYCKSDLNDWYYVGVNSLDLLTSKVTNLRFYTIIAMLSLMVIGVYVYYHVTKKLFNPVNVLIQDIKNQKGLDFNDNDNEFTVLSKAFNTIIKNQNQLSNSFEKNKKNIHDSYLFNLLQGNVEDITDSSLFEEIFPHEHFICFILSIDKYINFRKNFYDEQRYYLKTLILNICKQVFNEAPKCSGIILEKDKIAFIINSNIPEYTTNIKIITAKLNLINIEISKVLDYTISFGIGNQYSTKNELKNSYREAQKALKYKFILGYNCIIYYNEISTKSKEYYFSSTLKEHLINSIDSSSKEVLILEINNIVIKIKADNNLSYDNVSFIFTQLIGIAIRHLLDLNISISDIFGNDFNIYNELNENETIDDVSTWLINIYCHIIDYSNTINSSSKKHIGLIFSYINENYKKDIDINELAEKVGISYTQLRRIFLNTTGENLVSYINNMRISEAKRLLHETNDCILNIALSLGYNNDQSFNRFFRKYEGITAGEYRKINKKNVYNYEFFSCY